MKRSTVLMLAFGVALLHASCDKITCGSEFIQNQTSGTLFLLRTDSTTVDTLLAGDTLAFERHCGLSNFEVGETPIHGLDYIFIRNTIDFCKKDIRDIANWNTLKVETDKWEHRFIITEVDF